MDAVDKCFLDMLSVLWNFTSCAWRMDAVDFLINSLNRSIIGVSTLQEFLFELFIKL